MMKPRKIINSKRAYTLIELMIVMTIIGILASIVTPRFQILFQKATQAATKNSLGTIRSTIGVYYADNEGKYPFQNYPDEYNVAAVYNTSMSEMLCPKYLKVIPTPKLLDYQTGWNAIVGANYDIYAVAAMEQSTPIRDVSFFSGPILINFGSDTPFAYQQNNGHIYINSAEQDVKGQSFNSW